MYFKKGDFFVLNQLFIFKILIKFHILFLNDKVLSLNYKTLMFMKIKKKKFVVDELQRFKLHLVQWASVSDLQSGILHNFFPERSKILQQCPTWSYCTPSSSKYVFWDGFDGGVTGDTE